MTNDARKTRPLNLDDLLDLRTLSSNQRIVVSADGRYLSFSTIVDRTTEPPGPDGFPSGVHPHLAGVELMLADMQTKESKLLMPPGARSWCPSWSPKENKLVFYADHTGRIELWCWEPGKDPFVLCEEYVYGSLLGIDIPRWSEDGARVFIPLRLPGSIPLAAREKPAEETTDAPSVDIFVSEPTAASNDESGDGTMPGTLLDEGRDLGIVDVRTGEIVRLSTKSPAQGFYPSPDGRWVVIKSTYRQPDMSKFELVSDYSLLPSEGGEETAILESHLVSPAGSHDPAWSSDSKRVAFVKDRQVHVHSPESKTTDVLAVDRDFGERMFLWHPNEPAFLAQSSRRETEATAGSGSKLTFVRLTDGKPEVVEIDPPADATSPAILRLANNCWFFTSDNASFIGLVKDNNSSDSVFVRMPLDGSPPKRLFATHDQLTIAGVSSLPNGGGQAEIAIVYRSEDERNPSDFWKTDINIKSHEKVTQLNPALDEVALGRTRLVKWKNLEGNEINGCVLLPADFEEGNPVPMVTNVYPGSMQSGGHKRWGLEHGILDSQLLASRGIGVFLPDLPHRESKGSIGPGLTETVLSGLNELARLGIADLDRLGVMGQSAGGLTVNRFITRTTAFKAAVSAAGPSDGSGLFGQLGRMPNGSIEVFGVANAHSLFGGAPWETPHQYVDVSPVFHLDKVETPLLGIYGDDDAAVHPAQGAGMFVGLRSLGKKAMFLKYHKEGHVPSRYSFINRQHMTEQVIKWFEEHLLGPR